jgi:hypothetical protein
MHWWRIPAAEVPRDDRAVAEWLFSWWQCLDDWVGEHRPVP